ncbi:MAG: amidohydrolase family protein [Cyanobacteria bacterium J06638_7]
MTAAPERLRLRLPRALLDPRLAALPVGADDGLVAIELEQRQGRITALRPLTGGCGDPLPLALTPLVEPHAHLDKCFTAAAFPNPAGTIAGAMAANRRESEQRTAEQVLERAELALEQAWRHGLRAIRSHIDSAGPAALPSWEALLQLRRRWAGRVDLQLVALVPLAHWSSAEGEQLGRWVADRGGLLGGVLGPPYGHLRSDRDALGALLGLAERLGAGVDLHVDEAAEHPGRGVALLADVVAERSTGVPVTCSHAASMALLGPRRLELLAERLATAGIAVVALPLTNLWLLGRRPERTPKLRVQAPIRRLQRAGVLVAVGADNVQDPWFPGGDFDPVELLRLAPLTSHLWPAQRQGLAPFSSAPARLLGLEWDGLVREGGPADLVLLAAGSWTELLARTPRRLVLRDGRWLTPPALQQASALLPAVSMV